MAINDPMLISQRVMQVCFVLVGIFAVLGGCLQMYLGQPTTSPRLDNVHRFMAGIYLMSGVVGLWVAVTIRQHDTLIYLLALTVLVGGIGRLVSISQVGLPDPPMVWLGYLAPELILPVIILVAKLMTDRQLVAAS